MRIYLWRSIYLHLMFSRLAFFLIFCAFCQKTKPSWRTSFEPRTKVGEHEFANIQTAFQILSTLVLRDHPKWRANKSEHSGIMFIQIFVLEISNKKKCNPLWNHWSHVLHKLSWWSLKCAKIKIVDSSEFRANTFNINFLI